MKLASLNRGGRDGTLIVVDRALRRGVTVADVVPTMRAAIEDWDSVAGPLERAAAELERGTAIGALLGTLVIALIENGIVILRLAQEYRLVIIGLAIIIAVSLDRLGSMLRNR